MRRIATNAITRQLQGLHKLSLENEQTYHITSQLNSVERELDELNALVEQRIAINSRIDRLTAQLFDLQSQINTDLTTSSTTTASTSWSL